MNSKQLQYAVKLSKTPNFSQAAEQLKMSQPALSKQILSLEKELGVKLFDRSKNPMVLTPAGEHFIQKAEDLLYREDQLLRSMEQYRSGEVGQLTIGITPFRSSYMIPGIVKQVRDRYPGVQVRLYEAGSDVLRAGAVDGKYDFALVNLPVDDSVLDVIPLEPDRLVLLVPHSLQSRLPADPAADEIGFDQCRYLPFAVVGHSQEMRILFDKLCAAAEFEPNIAAEVVSLTTAWAMACSGAAATILPFQFVANRMLDSGIRVYAIKDAAYSRQPAIVKRKGQYVSDCARYAMDLLIGRFK